MNKPRILLWLKTPRPYERALAAAGLGESVETVHVPIDTPPPQHVLENIDAMLAWRATPNVLARMPKLKWVQALTAGVEEWLGRPDLREDIALTCARGVHRVAMPENILAALFHLTKPYVAAAFDQRERTWTRQVSEPLAGKTLGILGLGTIGQELAKKASALELEVIGTKTEPVALPHVAQVYPAQATDEVLARSDFVLLLLPATAKTENFMNADRIRAMRPTAYLLNFARGSLVVDDDLVDAVRNRTIAGAVLDVFRQEPLPPNHPFWVTEGITVLPHIGGLNPARDEIVAELFVDNVRRFIAGKPLRALVDRRRGY